MTCSIRYPQLAAGLAAGSACFLHQLDLNITLMYIAGSIGYPQLAAGLAEGSAWFLLQPDLRRTLTNS